MALEFHRLQNGQYFIWRDKLFQKVEDVFENNKLMNGIAKEIGGFDPQNVFGKEGKLFINPQGEGNFNPYCHVQPCQVVPITKEGVIINHGQY